MSSVNSAADGPNQRQSLSARSAASQQARAKSGQCEATVRDGPPMAGPRSTELLIRDRHHSCSVRLDGHLKGRRRPRRHDTMMTRTPVIDTAADRTGSLSTRHPDHEEALPTVVRATEFRPLKVLERRSGHGPEWNQSSETFGVGERRWRLASRTAVARLEVSRAGVTQLAECLLPKQNVAGSNPVSRSISSPSRSADRGR